MILEIEINDDEYPEVFATVNTPGYYEGLTGWGYSEASALDALRASLESTPQFTLVRSEGPGEDRSSGIHPAR